MNKSENVTFITTHMLAGETGYKLINKREYSSYPGALHKELTQDGRTAQGTTVRGSSRKASPKSGH